MRWNVALFLLFFACMLATDWLYVKKGWFRTGIWEHDPQLPFFAVAALVVNLSLHEGTRARRIGRSLAVVALQVVLLFLAWLTVGLSFHHAIGGQS